MLKRSDKIKAVLFDLDGTLLPMDQEVFIKLYFKELIMRFGSRYDGKNIINAVWKGTYDMMANDGSRSNFDAFWDEFCTIYGEQAREDIPEFDDFYKNEFRNTIGACSLNEWPLKTVELLRQKGYRLIAATNPIFPEIASLNRMTWSGLTPDMFEYLTHYENCSFCKPNEEYYRGILRHCGLSADECLMVGNDAYEDMGAEKLGIDTYLITDCLINTKNIDITRYKHGSFPEFFSWANENL